MHYVFRNTLQVLSLNATYDILILIFYVVARTIMHLFSHMCLLIVYGFIYNIITGTIMILSDGTLIFLWNYFL